MPMVAEDTVRVHNERLAEALGKTPSWVRKAAHRDHLVYPKEYSDPPRDTRDGYPVREWMDTSDRYGRARWFNVPKDVWKKLQKLEQIRNQR